MAISGAFWAGFGMHLFALVMNLLAFIMPLWIQSYAPSQSMFTKVGLWEVCFVNYVHEDDVEGTVWDGCYSTYRNGKIRDIWEWICPPWFISVQVLSTFALLCLLFACFSLVLYYVRCLSFAMHSCALWAVAMLSLSAGIIELAVVIVFGIFGDGQLWLPRADINYYSWSYAFAVISAFFAFLSGAAFIPEAMDAARRYRDEDRQLTLSAVPYIVKS